MPGNNTRRLAQQLMGLAIALTTLLLSGCAGTQFIRQSPSDLMLGSATHQEVLQRMGSPKSTGTTLVNGKSINTLVYSYASIGGTSAHKGVTAAHSQSFSFFNDVLVGTSYISSYAEDNTDFDESKVTSIEKGKSTRSEVIALLGQPSGGSIYPVTDDPTHKAITYAYVEVNGFKVYQKVLAVTFNSDDVVTNVTYNSVGTRETDDKKSPAPSN